MSNISDNCARFAWNLFSNVVGNHANENVFFSPTSVHVALAMTLAGAKTETGLELAKALQFDGVKDPHSSMGTLTGVLHSNQPGLKLSMANRMYVEKTTAIVSDFANLLEKNYRAGIGQVDFKQNYEAARQDINQWVLSNTNGKINDLLAAGSLNCDSRVVLVNAIHFKCEWEHPFHKVETFDSKFTVSAQKEIDVKMMSTKKNMKFGFSESLGVKMVSIPFKGEAYSMLIVLPSQSLNLDAVLSKISLSDILGLAKTSEELEVDLQLPRFKIEATLNLEEPKYLPALGIRKLFSRSEADLSGVTTDEKLVVSKVVHKAFLEVNEEGAEAAAATAVGMVCMMLDPNLIFFSVNEPFVLAIKDNATDTVLFMGKVVEPRE